MDPVIRTGALRKVFSDGWGKSGFIALENLTLEVLPSRIVGVLGANGSGKTTLLKLLCGLVHKTSGELSILGQEPKMAVRRNQIGYLPERPGYPEYSTPRKLLMLFARLSGLSGETLRKQVDDCVSVCQLDEVVDVRIGNLSKGGIQKLALAQALIHDPPLLVLDEPADGLDPLACEGFALILEALRSAGKTVVVSTHLVTGFEPLFDQMLVLNRGRPLFWGSPEFKGGFQNWLLQQLKEERDAR